MNRTFPPGDDVWRNPRRRYVRTGEQRPPRRGEWFLSGAVPTAYRASNDLDAAYHIVREATDAELHCPTCGQCWPERSDR